MNVRPGQAMVGRLAYLEIHGPQTLPWTGVALGQAVIINASSVYDVDWGDGHTDNGLLTQGGAYPNGNITHSYNYSGHYLITVTQRWTAAYSAGGVSGTIDNVLHTVGTLALPAFEVQSNRN